MEFTENIKSQYTNQLLRRGKEPISVLQFCDQLEISEQDFYSHYNSFKAVEKEIWKDLITQTIYSLHQDDDYSSFSAREKTLAFYYTLLEILKQNRSLVLFRLDNLIIKRTIPLFLTDFFHEYNMFMIEIIAEGFENKEIQSRPVISEHYDQVFNVSLGYILKVWVGDTSNEYQITDAAIEKSINLIFDLLQYGPIDSLVDFVKFIYQNKAY